MFEQDKVWWFLGNGAVPKRFCASLYGMRGMADGEAQYRLIDRRSTDDYKRVRGNYEPSARIWAFDEAILESVSRQSKPYATDDLQAFLDVPSPKQRTYDDELYRGAMFARSNWYLREGEIGWDGKSEEPPAYLLIFTSGEVAAFKNQEDLTSNELLIEAVRDLLDILLAAAYKL